MERRSMLKGLGGAVGLLLGGGAAAATNTTVLGKPILGQLDRTEGQAQAGITAAPAPHAALLDDCAEELYAYYQAFSKAGGLPTSIRIPFASKPTNFYVRQPNRESPPSTAALHKLSLLVQTERDGFPWYVRGLLVRVWSRINCDLIEAQTYQVPYLLVDGSLKPTRIVTPRFTVDIAELNGPRLAEMLAGLLHGIAQESSIFPRNELAAFGPEFEGPTTDVIKLMTPCKTELKLDAYMLEVWCYVELFACYGPESADYIVRVAPMLSREFAEKMQGLPKEQLAEDMWARRETAATRALTTDELMESYGLRKALPNRARNLDRPTDELKDALADLDRQINPTQMAAEATAKAMELLGLPIFERRLELEKLRQKNEVLCALVKSHLERLRMS